MRTEKNITDKIAELTGKERKLILMKLKQLVNKNKHASSSDKLKRLVAYVEPNEYAFDLENLKASLKESLPEYMIPSNINVIEEIPHLPNGKVDLKALASISKTIQKTDTNIQKPTTKIEEKLVTIWEEVLDFSPISTQDNFFEIGGDSILSIQIIARARKLGVEISPNQLFEHQTIAELALFISSTSDGDTNDNEIIVGEVPLSPIQKWFFETYKTAPEYWNQGIKFSKIPSSKKEVIKTVVTDLVIQHESLRLSFLNEAAHWKAIVLPAKEINAFEYFDISNLRLSEQETEITKILNATQENFVLAKGSLFKCLYFATGGDSNDKCLFVSHHLLVDAVSWQIITDTVLSKIENNTPTPTIKTTSIKKWNSYIEELAMTNDYENDFSFWKEQENFSTVMPTDFELQLPIREESIKTLEFKLDIESTQNLISNVNDTYNTKIDELLVTALVDSVCKWGKLDKLSLGMERHGRETNTTSMDLSNSVGWFTAYFPLLMQNKNGDFGAKIKSVKEKIRSIPNGGLSYGALKYLNTAITKKELSEDSPQVLFNFLGKQRDTDDTEAISVEFITDKTRHALSERYYVLEINSYIKNNQLHMMWSYSASVHKPSTIEILIEYFEKALIEIIMHCNKEQNGQYTPSDFPEALLNQDELDNLLNELE